MPERARDDLKVDAGLKSERGKSMPKAMQRDLRQPIVAAECEERVVTAEPEKETSLVLFLAVRAPSVHDESRHRGHARRAHRLRPRHKRVAQPAL
ncbi:MAG: hypothetical protein ABI202_02885 [Candidatus Baltobacteraceae bacterium]